MVCRKLNQAVIPNAAVVSVEPLLEQISAIPGVW